jgi:hypothetical protein
MSIIALQGLRPPRILLMASATMVAVIAAEWVLLSRDPPIPAASGALPPQASAQAPLISLPPAASFAEITQRPLFNQARRPEPPDLGRQGPATGRPNLTLLGIVMSGNTHYALIRHGNPAKVESLAEGQAIDGWQIQTIGKDRVSLTSRSGSADFLLGNGGLPSAGTPPQSPGGNEPEL